jgi:hypothetical protein
MEMEMELQGFFGVGAINDQALVTAPMSPAPIKVTDHSIESDLKRS